MAGERRAGLARLWVPLRALAERFAGTSLIVVAVLLLIVGKMDLKVGDYVGDRVGGLFVPALGLLGEPLRVTRRAAERLGELLALRAENERLREENRRLLTWQTEATRLAVQNRALREQLNIPPVEQAPAATVARVVADSGGPFVHTLLIDAGMEQGVQSGMAAVNERGLIGRVVRTGGRSARVLLLTDFNSRIPVLVERSRDRAVLEGDNSRRPLLRFLPLTPRLEVGDRVLTSGDGDLLPPGLVIGEISSISDTKVRVTPYVDWARLDYLTVLRYERLPEPDDDAAGGALAGAGSRRDAQLVSAAPGGPTR
ncbi:MAG TPA: rod shape-determining protein MreC [Geminicoccaceae bacterium]|nr:rod shape-determining protein MreC [Geminicoccaceae bacterium]